MRPALLNVLFQPVGNIAGVGAKLSKLVGNLCGPYWADVLWHLPCDVVHRPLLRKEEALSQGTLGTLPVEITEHLPPPNKRLPYRIRGICETMETEIVFFNYHASYLREKFPPDKTVWISGRWERQGGLLKILHPDYVAARSADIPVFETIYPQQKGVSSRLIRQMAETILPRLPALSEWLDAPFQKKQELPAWQEALRQAHRPRTSDDLNPQNPARKRLAYDELLANQLALLLVRNQERKKTGVALAGAGQLPERLLSGLGFALTGAQLRIDNEIKKDLEGPCRMVRLLQGDVGSGKTIVALLALLRVVEAGFQGVVMAPTDILARQHFQTFTAYCAPLHVEVGLLTAREKGAQRRQILESVRAGKTHILIGTHALLGEEVVFQNLGLSVIDEQHKFGVHQRLMLAEKQRQAHLLVMTATPIPRSLALTAYGDMDISRLDEKPPGRQAIETRVMPIAKIPELADKLKRMSDSSGERRQAYWVCPLVEESEKSDLTAVEARYAALKQVFGQRVGLVHGKMKSAEKEAVMKRFWDGDITVLVATTVIEVGVDVKTAHVMIVEHAERFGLAALHQLRGRVGRGGQKAQCLLLYGPGLTQAARARLQKMRETDDGFLIAEEDLKLRGAGEVLGVRQSGLPAFKMADLMAHGDLLWTATQDARTILSLDPRLESPRGQALRLLLYLFQKDAEIATLKAG